MASANHIYSPYAVQAVNTSTTLIENVTSVSWSEMGGGAPAAADNDIYATAIIPSPVAVTISINSSDVDPGLTMHKSYSTLEISAKIAQSASTATLVFTNAVYFGNGGGLTHGGDGTVSHSFGAWSVTGQATPVTWTGASS